MGGDTGAVHNAAQPVPAAGIASLVLTDDEVLQILKNTGVILDGHFLLTSGRHSPRFMQMSQVWQYPAEAERLARALARKVDERLGAAERLGSAPGEGAAASGAAFAPSGTAVAEAVVGPAMGGVIIGYEVARALGLRSLYTEKEGEGMALKRGFRVHPGERVLMTEDAVTTGGSVRKAMDALRAAGAVPVAVATAVDRSLGQADLGVPLISLVQVDIPSYPPEDCPLCRQGLPLTKPKSVTARE